MTRCGKKCEVYSRVVGYHRPVQNWNKGKKQEYNERQTYAEDSNPTGEPCLTLKVSKE